jgi:hypothetical protein
MQTDLGDGIVLYDQSEWRGPLEQPNFGSMPTRALESIREFIVDETRGLTYGSEKPIEWIRALYHAHTDGKRYADIAYHYAVVSGGDGDGQVYELRDNAFVGAHSIASPADGISHNTLSTGVLVLKYAAGLTPKARVALRKLYGLVTAQAGWRLPHRVTHSEILGAAPVGADLLDFVHNGLAQPAPGPSVGPIASGTVHPHVAHFEPPEAPADPLHEGVRDEDLEGDATPVKTWQAKMNELGHGPIEESGVFDGQTEAATMRFQQAVGLEGDGYVDAEDWQAAFSV